MSESVVKESGEKTGAEFGNENNLVDDIAGDAMPTDAGTGIDPQALPRPEATNPMKVMWSYTIVLGVVHLVALYAVLPWTYAYLFTWSGLILGILGHFVFGMMGITIGYHRLLTHRGFTCPKVAGTYPGDSWHVQLAGFTCSMGRDSPHAPPTQRPPTRSALAIG